MKQEVRKIIAQRDSAPRSERYPDYQDVPRVMTVLVRDQATGEYNEPHVHRHGQLLYASNGVMRWPPSAGCGSCRRNGRCGFRPE